MSTVVGYLWLWISKVNFCLHGANDSAHRHEFREIKVVFENLIQCQSDRWVSKVRDQN